MHAYMPAPSDDYNNEILYLRSSWSKIMMNFSKVCGIIVGRGVKRHFIISKIKAKE